MRELTDADRLRRFMQALGAEADREARVYLTGGATAVLLGWRRTTIDADIAVFPESVYRYPAIDPPSFRRAVEDALARPG